MLDERDESRAVNELVFLEAELPGALARIRTAALEGRINGSYYTVFECDPTGCVLGHAIYGSKYGDDRWASNVTDELGIKLYGDSYIGFVLEKLVEDVYPGQVPYTCPELEQLIELLNRAEGALCIKE